MKTVKTSELLGQVLIPFPKGRFSALIRSGKSCAARWRWPQRWGMGPGLLVSPVLLLSRLNSFHSINNSPGLSATVYKASISHKLLTPGCGPKQACCINCVTACGFNRHYTWVHYSPSPSFFVTLLSLKRFPDGYGASTPLHPHPPNY